MLARRRITLIVGLPLIALLGYSGAVGFTPLPELRAEMTVEAETRFEAESTGAEAAVMTQQRPTAVGWQHDEQIWANDNEPHRIASITKLITVLVGLEAAPVEAGTDGPSFTISEHDAELVDEVLAQDGTFAPMPVGLQLTTRQMLDLILVPSANNYAIAYARWIFGSDEAFLAAANDWLTRHGLTSTRIFEAAGLNDDNSSTAADVVRLTRIALDDPLVAQIVSQSVVQIPELGEITTTNRLLGEPGVIGVKTGTTFPEGYSLAAAQHEDASGRDLVAIAVTLDRADADARANDTRAVLASAAAAVQSVPLVEAHERIGTVTTWQGEEVALVASDGATATLVPGETSTRMNELAEVKVGPAGQQVGTVSLTLPSGDTEIAVVTDRAIEQPGFWWRFTHPGAVFGGR